jgi:iron-sulfur cluster assembly protein
MSDVEQYVANTQEAITVTAAAKEHLLACLIEEKGSLGVRFSVKKTGCSGLSYVVDYVKEPLDNDIVIPLDKYYWIWIDKASYPYLKGVSVDYVKQGLNYKFVFTNPNQTGQCGCGESFTVNEKI